MSKNSRKRRVKIKTTATGAETDRARHPIAAKNSRLTKAAEFKSGAESYIPYNLIYPSHVIRGRYAILDVIYDRFIRLFRHPLSAKLNQIASVSLISTDLIRYGEFENTLPIPILTYILKSKTLDGLFLMCFEPKITYSLIDTLAGGSGKLQPKVEGKEFTNIEIELMTIVSSTMLDCINEAWAPVMDLQAEIIHTEILPQAFGIASSSDIIISTTFEIELENAAGTMALIIPLSLLDPIRDKLKSGFLRNSSQKVNKNALSITLRDAPTEITADLDLPSISVKGLRNMTAGDVIQVSPALLKNIDLKINQTTVATGELEIGSKNYKIRLSGQLPALNQQAQKEKPDE